MTIANLDGALKEIITNHSVYGAECTINALVRNCKNHPYLKEDDLIRLVRNAFKHEKENEKR